MKNKNPILFSILEYRYNLNEQLAPSVETVLKPEAEAVARRGRVVFQDLLDRLTAGEGEATVHAATRISIPHEVESGLRNEFLHLRSTSSSEDAAIAQFYQRHPEAASSDLEYIVTTELQTPTETIPMKPPYELPPTRPQEFPTSPSQDLPSPDEIELVPGQKPWKPRGTSVTPEEMAEPTKQRITTYKITPDEELGDTPQAKQERDKVKPKQSTTTDTKEEGTQNKKFFFLPPTKKQKMQNPDFDLSDIGGGDVDPDISSDRYLGKYASTYRIR